MKSSIDWKRHDLDGISLFRLSGSLNETLPLHELQTSLPSTLVFDVEGISEVTSSGVQAWKALLEKLHAHDIFFLRASCAFVRQMNADPPFVGHGKLIHFLAPYLCVPCELEVQRPVDVRFDLPWMRKQQPPRMSCSSCGEPMQFSEDVGSYFTTAFRMTELVLPRGVKALADGTLHVTHPLRVEKEIFSHVTVLWVSGSFHHVRALGRFLEGAEGEVFLHFHHTQHPTSENLERLLSLLEALPLTVTLSQAPVELLKLRQGRLWPTHVRMLSVDAVTDSPLPHVVPSEELVKFLQASSTRAKMRHLAFHAFLPKPLPFSATRFGDYQLVERLEQGPGLEVFLARRHDSPDGPTVLLNRVVEVYQTDLAFQDALLREVKLASRLQHPNIARIGDAGTVDSQVYFTTEAVEGLTLKQALRLARAQNRPMPLGLAVWVATEITKALVAAHGHRTTSNEPLPIFHRGLEPHCVLLSFEGEVKVTHFGLAHAADNANVTPSQTLLGSRRYLAPEQIRLGVGLPDGRVDLFPVGLILYECATLESMYAKENEYATMWAVLNEPPKSLSAHVKNVPLAVEEVLAKCLQKDAQLRFSSSQRLLEALESLLPLAASHFDLPDLKKWLAALKF